jgi:hypothetical protein
MRDVQALNILLAISPQPDDFFFVLGNVLYFLSQLQ